MQTKPKTAEKHDHAQTRSFAVIHWCFPYDLNYFAGFQSSFLGVFSSLLKETFRVSFGLWYCMEIRHFNGKLKPCERTAVMRLLGAGFSLDGAGFVGATRGRRPWSSVILSLSAVKQWVCFSHWGHFLRLNKHTQSVCSGNSVAFSLTRWASS